MDVIMNEIHAAQNQMIAWKSISIYKTYKHKSWTLISLILLVNYPRNQMVEGMNSYEEFKKGKSSLATMNATSVLFLKKKVKCNFIQLIKCLAEKT